MNVRRFFCLSFLLCLGMMGCNTLGVVEQNENFPSFEWSTSNKANSSFTVSDTNSLYNIYIVIRHEDAYHYNNLWVNVTTQAPNTAPVKQQLELILAQSNKGWLGQGVDDIFTHRIRITQSPVKLKMGQYHFTIEHTMRENPLKSVLSAGIRVEKVAS